MFPHQASSKVCQPHDSKWPESKVGHLFLRNNSRKNGCCLVLYGRVLTTVSEGHKYVIRILEERPPRPVNAQNLTCVSLGTATPGAACQRKGSIMAADSLVHPRRRDCSTIHTYSSNPEPKQWQRTVCLTYSY